MSKLLNKIKSASRLVLISLVALIPSFLFTAIIPAYAATSPSLGEAASFAVLAGTAVTNVPTSVITGDVGLSPAAGSNYAGLTNGEVSGTIFAPDSSGPAGSAGSNPSMLTTAKTDLVTAYDGLSAGSNAACTHDYGAVSQDLVGLSLTPGVYCANSFTLSGTLTLDDTGAPNGVWIFRAALDTLITSAGSVAKVQFLNGIASPCNVWWEVPSSATLNTGTVFIGNILALTSIGMKTGATLQGRALARNAAVTLQSNTINQSCTAIKAKTSTTTNTSSTTSLSTAGPPSVQTCPAFSCQTPIILESKRVSPTSIFLSWGPDTDMKSYNIQYGLENGKWLYNTDVTGYSTTINDLPPNQAIWFLIQPRDNCSIGPCGVAKLIGGTGGVGGPRLPDTGVDPNDNHIPWNVAIPVGMLFFVLSAFIVKVKRV